MKVDSPRPLRRGWPQDPARAACAGEVADSAEGPLLLWVVLRGSWFIGFFSNANPLSSRSRDCRRGSRDLGPEALARMFRTLLRYTATVCSRFPLCRPRRQDIRANCQTASNLNRRVGRQDQEPASVSVTLDPLPKCVSLTLMSSTNVFTIKQLHDDTGSLVRRAGASQRPIPITDRGREVAVIGNRALLRPVSRQRAILPEYETMMAESPGHDIQAALDEIRGDR